MAHTGRPADAKINEWLDNFKPERHNLFLSHAGEDKAFVRMLHEELKTRHHNPFLDQEPDSLPLGCHFPDTIYESICKCQVIVFVLSEHFVTKKWPMLELVAACRQPKNIRPIMLPIFYKLDVGKIDKANLQTWCKVWKSQAKKDPQVDSGLFSEALKALTRFSGVRNSLSLDDYSFAKKVASEICGRVTPIKLWVNDTMEKAEEFCSGLSGHFQKHVGNNKILGMWGESGTGKTWIAMALCRHFYQEYCGWACLMDISRKKDKLEMAKAMYLSLRGKEMDKTVDTEQVAQQRLEDFIKGKSFFLVLDNLTLTTEGIAEFALETLRHCKECKVLIMAREKKLLETLLKPYNDAASIIAVPSLDKQAAANILLRLTCPDRKWNDLTLEEQNAIFEVCESHLQDADFQPLLTNVVGMYIARLRKNAKDPRSWPALIEGDTNFKTNLDSRLFSLINEQFQSMTANHLQDFYIDATLYDVAIETTLNGICDWLSIIHGCRPKTVLKKLEKVRESGFLDWGIDEDDEFFLDEPDEDPEIITTNMAAKFAMRQVLQNPEKWGWFFYNGIVEEEEKKMGPQGTLQDDEIERGDSFAPPRPKEVKRIEKIALIGGRFQDVGEVLNLTHYTKAVALVLSRCSEVEELNVEWNTHLKAIEVEYCKILKRIEGLEDLTQLVCLRIISTSMSEVELQLGKLGRLQKLEICSTDLSKTPNLQGCFKLRELILKDNPRLQSLPECWSGFSRLTKISFAENESILTLPDLSPLAPVLRNLDISFCTNLKFAACISSLTSLQNLCLDFCSALNPLPDLKPLTFCDLSIMPPGLHAEAEQAWLATFINEEDDFDISEEDDDEEEDHYDDDGDEFDFPYDDDDDDGNVEDDDIMMIMRKIRNISM